MEAYAFNPSTQKAEAEELWVPGQPGLRKTSKPVRAAWWDLGVACLFLKDGNGNKNISRDSELKVALLDDLHLKDKSQGLKRLINWTKVTQLALSRTGVQTQAIWPTVCIRLPC